jgi:hypothetical protein
MKLKYVDVGDAQRSALDRDFEALTNAVCREFIAYRQRFRDSAIAAYDAHRALTRQMRAVITASTREFTACRQRLTTISEQDDIIRDDFVVLITGLIAELDAHNMRGIVSKDRALRRHFEALITTMTQLCTAYQLPPELMDNFEFL